MKRLLLAALISVLWAAAASAQSIFAEPPREAFGLGLVLAYEGKVLTVIQQPAVILDTCGDEEPWGCITPLGDACQIHLVIVLPDDIRRAAWRHLVARCAGWRPPI